MARGGKQRKALLKGRSPAAINFFSPQGSGPARQRQAAASHVGAEREPETLGDSQPGSPATVEPSARALSAERAASHGSAAASLLTSASALPGTGSDARPGSQGCPLALSQPVRQGKDGGNAALPDHPQRPSRTEGTVAPLQGTEGPPSLLTQPANSLLSSPSERVTPLSPPHLQGTPLASSPRQRSAAGEQETDFQGSMPAEPGTLCHSPALDTPSPGCSPESPVHSDGSPMQFSPGPRAPRSRHIAPSPTPQLSFWEPQVGRALPALDVPTGPSGQPPQDAWCKSQPIQTPGAHIQGTLHQLGTTAVGDTGLIDASLPSIARAVMEIYRYIYTLPTKADLDATVDKWSAGFQQEIKETKETVTQLEMSLQSQARQHSDLAQRVAALESGFQSHASRVALHIDDLENRSRRNNIKIRGIPEATPDSELHAVTTAIFNMLLNKPPTTFIELDRVHRLSPASRNEGSSPPRDVLCRVHFFTVKEAIMRRARERGRIMFDGAELSLYPDLSRRTLAMRRSLRPLLDVIRAAGGTYYWGYPLSLTIRLRSDTFLLSDPAQLPEAFRFLQVEPVSVPNWLLLEPNAERPLPPRQGSRRGGRRRTPRSPGRGRRDGRLGSPRLPPSTRHHPEP